MLKVILFTSLFVSYAAYSIAVYTTGTETKQVFSWKQQRVISQGKQIFQDYNCSACHQVFGLGGYLGPDLTNCYSEKGKGIAYLQAMLDGGSAQMPAYNFTAEEKNALIAYLAYIDNSSR